MSRRIFKRNQTAASLFPFLAVLICTMGAIIVLLVLVVKRADIQADQATAAYEEAIAEQTAERQDSLERQENQVAILASLRPDLKKRLQAEKTLFGHLIEHVTRLKDEHEQLAAELEQLDHQVVSHQDNQQVPEEIDELERSIKRAKQRLANKRKQLANVKPAFSIIPNSKGVNGTFRRPVFIECDARGVTIQPYGITLLPKDFPKSMTVGNPLDVGLLMVRDYWNQVDPNQKRGQAYPLLVVRPTGSKSFAAARKAMKSWVDEFGYELVASDVDLTYPEVDEQFKQRLQVSVERVRQAQKEAVATINRQKTLQQDRLLKNQSGGKGVAGYRASSLNGGFVQERSARSRETRSKEPLVQLAAQSSTASSDQPGISPKRSSDNGRLIAWQSLNSLETRSAEPSNTPAGRDSQFQPGKAVKKSSSAANRGPQPKPSSSSSTPMSSGNWPPESIARDRGTGWALPSKANNSIQVRKPIKLVVGKDAIQMIVIGQGIQAIPFGDSTRTVVPQLVEQVWRHIEAWGIAGVNSYWKPVLNTRVTPGAESRFTDLERLLSGSGFSLERVQ
ncbi:MAG: hypothetical protein VX438_01245 [Planctomycetota bacterium]|nr:hypothetical protein [Planctomycetota bacterium]